MEFRENLSKQAKAWPDYAIRFNIGNQRNLYI